MILLLLLACTPEPAPMDTGTPEDTGAPLDLVSPLGPGQVRAGQIADPGALFGGVSSEGRVGDFKIYNDRVQFVIQGIREGNGLAWQGGGVVDADVVRPPGQPGRDLVDEWMVMAGTGHLMAPVSVSVVDDGQISGRATIRVEGPESPFLYITGAMESPELIPDQGMYFVTEFTLPADSWLLEVKTTVQATGADVATQVGDVVLGSKELGSPWVPGLGSSDDYPTAMDWVGYVSRRNELAVGVFALPGSHLAPHPALGAFSGLISAISAFTAGFTVPAGRGVTFTRYYGVGPDPAALTDAWLELGARSTVDASGQVTAPDGPVPGARVTVLADGSPFTLAFTDEEGRFSALAPAGASLSWTADGHGTGTWSDLPEGAASWGSWSDSTLREPVLDSYRAGALPVPLAAGRGWVASDGPDLALEEPGTLRLVAADGLPFEARISWSGGVDVGAESVVQRAPDGYAALAWARDGEVELPLEPGAYGLVAWRGTRWETVSSSVSLTAGQLTVVDLDLPLAHQPQDWVTMDAHVHGAPSPDAAIPMEDRVVVSAAKGIQFHIATDHDNIADYRPIVEAMGLDPLLASVPACEVSSLLRGHLNVFPVDPDPEEVNGGPWLWWTLIPESTQQTFDLMREWAPDALIQANHPTSGLATMAGWWPGHIDDPDHWTEDFQLVEVNNGGSVSAQEFYLDLAVRGLDVAPTAVSDSHGYLWGGYGQNLTWVECGASTVPDCTPDALVEAVRDGRVVASNGPFLELSTPPGFQALSPQVLEVKVRAPSWIGVDTLTLIQDDAVVATLAGSEGSFDLSPSADAVYHVMATGSTPMSPVSWGTPWALSGPLRVDPEGDGWSAPLPPLELRE